MLSVVSPYIDTFNLFPKAKRVNTAPAYDPEAGYRNVTGDTPTEVHLSDAPKMISFPKIPRTHNVTNYLPAGNGSVPLYASQIRDTTFDNSNKYYASQFNWKPVSSGFEKHLDEVFDKLQVKDFNKHRTPSKTIGESSLNLTTHEQLERLIRNL